MLFFEMAKHEDHLMYSLYLVVTFLQGNLLKGE